MHATLRNCDSSRREMTEKETPEMKTLIKLISQEQQASFIAQ